MEGGLEELRDAGVGVVAVGFSAQDRLDALRSQLDLSFPVVSDPEREWYRALRVPRGRWRAVLAPRILGRYLRGLLRGERLPAPRDDLRQLGAGALLRRTTVVRAWVTDESERRPALAEIIAAARMGRRDER